MEDIEGQEKSPFERFRTGLKELRGWDDRQPKTFIYGQGKNMYRRNFWGVLTNRLYIGLSRDYIPEDLREEVQEFYDHYISDEFKGKKLTAPEDVEKAKEILDKLLAQLPAEPEEQE